MLLIPDGNPEAIHFNVNKKLAQLNKVIDIFQSGDEERIFRKQYLRKKYDSKILNIMTQYSEKMDNINQKMKLVNDDSNSKFYQIYHSKYESTKKEFKDTISKIYDKHNSQIDKQDRTVSIILNTLKKINNNMNNKYNPSTIEKESIELIKYLKQFQQDSQQKLQKDISETHEKSSTQIKEHKESFKNRIAELKTQHQQKIKEIQTSYLEKKQQMENNRKAVLNQKLDSVKKIRNLCLKQKSIINQISEEYKSMISAEKEKISSLIQELNDNITKSHKELSDHKKAIKKKINEISQLSKTYYQDIEEKQIQYRNEEDERKDKLAKLRASHKKEIDEKTEQYNLNQQQIKSAIDSIENQIRTEFEKTKEKLSEISNSKSSKLKENEKTYKDLLQSNNDQLIQLRNNFSQNKLSHSSEIEERKNKNGQEIVEIRQNHFNMMKKIQNSITENKDKTEKQKAIYIQDINDINNQKQVFLSFMNQQRLDDKKDFHKKIDDLMNSNNDEIEKVKADEEKKLFDFKKLKDEQIENHRKLLMSKKEQFSNDKISQNEQNLSNFEKIEKINNQKIIDDFNLSYQEREKKMNDELNSISTTTSSEDQLKFQNLTEKFNNLTENKANLIQKNIEDKENLTNSFKQLVDDENKRHFAFLSSLSKNNNGRNTRQKVLTSLKNQINQTIEDRITLTNKLKEDKEKMKEQFVTNQSNYLSQKTEYINNSNLEESNLLKEIEDLRQNMIVAVENKRKELENEIINKKKEIDNLNIFYLNEKDDLYLQNSANLAYFNEEFQRLKEIYNLTLDSSHFDFSEESKNNLNKTSNLSSDYYLKQKKLKLKIKDLSASINREKYILDDKTKRNLSQNLDKISQFEKSVKFTLQKTKDDNEGLFGFLDEKIEVLENKLKEIKKKCNDKASQTDEAKRIEFLTLRLSSITSALNHAIANLKRCKSIDGDHENKKNPIFERKTKFGAIPS